MDIDNLTKLSIGRLKRFCQKNKCTEGIVSWGESKIQFKFNIVARIMELSYCYNGEPVNLHYQLSIVRTNLGKGVQCFAHCPVTHKKCRKLYLYGKTFVGRCAFPHTYSACNRSHKTRDFEKIFSLIKIEFKNRKEYYRGHITPFGLKAEKALANYRELDENTNPFNVTKKHKN